MGRVVPHAEVLPGREVPGVSRAPAREEPAGGERLE